MMSKSQSTSSKQSSSKSRNPSVQAFFPRQVHDEKTLALKGSSIALSRDGFTAEEVANALDPLHCHFDANREYEDSPIAQLVPGPRAVTFAGRIVNLSTMRGRDAKHPKAAGWHSIIVKDNSAAISVKLYFASTPYPLRLGQLVSCWSAFISDASKIEKGVIKSVGLYASLFPARVNSDSITIHTTASIDKICRTPLDYTKGYELAGLITLENYVRGGNDGVSGVKLLVCVKNIGARKRIPKAGGGEYELTDIGLFDYTTEVTLTVWGDMIDSARMWQAGKTILLISSPGWSVSKYNGKGKIGITKETMIDIDPDFPDADWLQRHATSLIKKEAPCLRFPDGIWDLHDSKFGVNRILFRLAEIDEWARSNPQIIFSGFINIVIMDLGLVDLHRRGMLMCSQCCGVPMFANRYIVKCRNCLEDVTLSPNPKIFGTLVDETGCIEPGKLIWHDDAWKDIFDRDIEGIATMDLEVAGLYEQRLDFMRMHLCFGWSLEVGRLCIMGMMA